VVFFLYGPQKIPELARVVAQARREFDRASKEFQNVAAGIQNGTSALVAPPRPAKQATTLPQTSQQAEAAAPPAPSAPTFAIPGPKTGDQLLIEAARRIGIQTQGKTREQIQEEIIARAQRPASGGAPDPSSKADSTA
jgi:sec-independent protein translocase protein TatA